MSTLTLISGALAEYTTPQLMIPQLHHDDAPAIISELCAALGQQGWVHDQLALYSSVMNRESIASTALSGWALPHARVEGLSRLCFAVGRTAKPINWFGHSGGPIRLVFLFAVPQAQTAAYLTLISALAKFSSNQSGIQHLLEAGDSQAMFDILEQIPLRPPRSPAPRF